MGLTRYNRAIGAYIIKFSQQSTYGLVRSINVVLFKFDEVSSNIHFYGSIFCILFIIISLWIPKLLSVRNKKYMALLMASTTPLLIPVAAYQYYGDCATFFILRTPYERASAWFDYYTKISLEAHNKSWALANMKPKYKTVSGVVSILFKFAWSPCLTLTVAFLCIYLLSSAETTPLEYLTKMSGLNYTRHILLSLFVMSAFFKVNKYCHVISLTLAFYFCWHLLYTCNNYNWLSNLWDQKVSAYNISEKNIENKVSAPLLVMYHIYTE